MQNAPEVIHLSRSIDLSRKCVEILEKCETCVQLLSLVCILDYKSFELIDKTARRMLD